MKAGKPLVTNRYAAPWGISVKLVTLFISVVLFGIPLAAIAMVHVSGLGLLIVVVPLSIWVFTLPFMVLGYELTADELRIRRFGWKSVFPLNSLRSAQYNPNAMARSLRTFGNGGLFSVCGHFKNRELGHYRAFVTDPKNAVVLRFGEKTVVVSPERPEAFVAALDDRVAPKEEIK